MARIERLILNGRVFVLRGQDVQQLVAFLRDAEIEYDVRASARGGWWVTL